MPFTAVHNGDIVWPDDVADGTSVVCPECGDSMHVRSGHTTADGILKPRCFAHNPNASVGGMCPGGESDEHKLMKYVVTRRLQRMFDHGTVEREVSVPGTDRVGDVVVTFEDSFQEFGRGVVAEVQYRHDDKDIESVTQEYLRAGFSVYWLKESHFGEDLETVEFPDMVTAWPNAVPTPGEWSGIEESVENLDNFGSRYAFELKMPPEFFQEHEDDLKTCWRMGGGQYDFDLVRPLSSNNATRSCDECGDRAELYLFQDGVISSFRCREHTPDSLNADALAEYGQGSEKTA